MLKGVTKIFKDPQPPEAEDINLLLLGETGVGKSTFINSISNYFKYRDFKSAQKGKIQVLIPVRLNLLNESKICGDPDQNETHESGAAATQHVKVYLFPIKMGEKVLNLRLVDTPGVGDPRGIEQDNINIDNILAYLATLSKLHGICFLMKSNQSRFTSFIEYCLKQILSRLDKSASQNIIFITTYSKTAQYTAGETKIHCLEPLVKNISSKPPHVNIPLSKKNIFSLDNEAFRALLEMQEGTTFDKRDLEIFSKSWSVSSKECRRLLTYITGDRKTAPLQPHQVENTISVNEVRFLIEQLATPIAEVSELIQDNLRVLDRHKKKLTIENQTLDELKEKLFLPCVDLKVTELNQPVTVCTDTKCAEVVKVKEVTQWHYRQKCHNPCYLSGIPKEMVGDPGLVNCAAMSGRETCNKCECNWRVHMHIYKMTEKVEIEIEDQNVKDAIKTKEEARVKIEELIKDLNKRMKELEKEGEVISESIAKFSYFLQEHALTPFNDAYSDYIKQLIKNEKHLGKFADQTVIEKLEKLLQKHEHLQKTFKQSEEKFQSKSEQFDLTPQGIKESITQLYGLNHMGKKIEELIKKTTACRNKETQKNFNCVVSQKIDLNAHNEFENNKYQGTSAWGQKSKHDDDKTFEKTAESAEDEKDVEVSSEEEKRDPKNFSRKGPHEAYDSDGSTVRQGRSRSPSNSGSECDLDGPGEHSKKDAPRFWSENEPRRTSRKKYSDYRDSEYEDDSESRRDDEFRHSEDERHSRRRSRDFDDRSRRFRNEDVFEDQVYRRSSNNRYKKEDFRYFDDKEAPYSRERNYGYKRGDGMKSFYEDEDYYYRRPNPRDFDDRDVPNFRQKKGNEDDFDDQRSIKSSKNYFPREDPREFDERSVRSCKEKRRNNQKNPFRDENDFEDQKSIRSSKNYFPRQYPRDFDDRSVRSFKDKEINKERDEDDIEDQRSSKSSKNYFLKRNPRDFDDRSLRSIKERSFGDEYNSEDQKSFSNGRRYYDDEKSIRSSSYSTNRSLQRHGSARYNRRNDSDEEKSTRSFYVPRPSTNLRHSKSFSCASLNRKQDIKASERYRNEFSGSRSGRYFEDQKPRRNSHLEDNEFDDPRKKYFRDNGAKPDSRFRRDRGSARARDLYSDDEFQDVHHEE